MEEAVRARGATQEAIQDVTPDRLRAVIERCLTDASMTPGVLTLLTTRANDPTESPLVPVERAAGVQLIYEGLRLTRTLAHENPWASPEHSAERHNLEILAADVMVARGFYLLARTEAANKAVSTVREFGRDQSADEADASQPAHSLEANVFELAVIAGTTAGGAEVPPALRKYVIELARSLDTDPLPSAERTLNESVSDMLEKLATQPGAVRSADDVVWQSSATDP